MANANKILIGGVALGAIFLAMHNRTLKIPGAAMSKAEVLGLAQSLIEENNFNVSPWMVAGIAEIESGLNPLAVRYEWRLNDASIGLMQTLSSTAKDLATSFGYSRFGVPDAIDLFEAEKSLYFGCAYLSWLRTYRDLSRSDEWVVKSYNGGPGNVDGSQVANYWAKYLNAVNGTPVAAATEIDGGGLGDSDNFPIGGA